MKKKIGILTSGGDTPGMNAVIRSVVMAADAKNIPVLGITKGYAGLIDGRVAPISVDEVDEIVDKGGTILKTARSQRFRTEEGQKQALEVISAFGITDMVVVGGDGSFQGAKVLSHLGIPTIGVPGTIDNDLAYTDYTIGFDTAVNCVIQEMAKIRDTMESHERVGVIEVMGNKCGDIALHAAIAGGAEYVILPEVPFDIDAICQKIVQARIKGKMTSIVLIAEGAGKGEAVANYMRAKAKLDAKAIALGYIQRGGSPSAFDILIASRMGNRAVELLAQGIGNRVVGIRADRVIDEDIDEALSRELTLDTELYETYNILSGNA